MGGTIKCKIWGAPYKWYSMTVVDQSACPKCVGETERRERFPSDEEQREYERRRTRYFKSY